MRYLHPIDEARDCLGGIGRTKIYELVGDGELRLVKIGSKSLITNESIKAYLAKISDAADAKQNGIPAARLNARNEPQRRS